MAALKEVQAVSFFLVGQVCFGVILFEQWWFPLPRSHQLCCWGRDHLYRNGAIEKRDNSAFS